MILNKHFIFFFQGHSLINSLAYTFIVIEEYVATIPKTEISGRNIFTFLRQCYHKSKLVLPALPSLHNAYHGNFRVKLSGTILFSCSCLPLYL